MPQWPSPYSETDSSRPVVAAVLAIPDLVAFDLLGILQRPRWRPLPSMQLLAVQRENVLCVDFVAASRNLVGDLNFYFLVIVILTSNRYESSGVIYVSQAPISGRRVGHIWD